MLANQAAASYARLLQVIRHSLQKIQYQPSLLEGCLAGTGLSLEPAYTRFVSSVRAPDHRHLRAKQARASRPPGGSPSASRSSHTAHRGWSRYSATASASASASVTPDGSSAPRTTETRPTSWDAASTSRHIRRPP
jgi:hypothetical protein